MDPVALQRFFNFLVSRARAAVIELQDRVRDGRLDDAYKQRWYTHLLEEMVRITVVILFIHVMSFIVTGISFHLPWCWAMLWLVPLHPALLQELVTAVLRSMQ
jgi:hypothetical protein